MKTKIKIVQFSEQNVLQTIKCGLESDNSEQWLKLGKNVEEIYEKVLERIKEHTTYHCFENIFNQDTYLFPRTVITYIQVFDNEKKIYLKDTVEFKLMYHFDVKERYKNLTKITID